MHLHSGPTLLKKHIVADLSVLSYSQIIIIIGAVQVQVPDTEAANSYASHALRSENIWPLNGTCLLKTCKQHLSIAERASKRILKLLEKFLI